MTLIHIADGGDAYVIGFQEFVQAREPLASHADAAGYNPIAGA
ncbi:MAG TPA: hypothetical protein VM120_20055 [Bryobacteraceae bacterium]|nr:hypothetical protein [Bryobacteraceae bacterium]